MNYEQLSEEARKTIKVMVEHCINHGLCMGMDEGIADFESGEKHKFRQELEAFCKTNYPDCFKIKLGLAGSKDLVVMYDFLFDILHASWAGRSGHHAYGHDARFLAKNQDGFIYCFKKLDSHTFHTITADSVAAKLFGKEWPEIDYLDAGNAKD